MQQQQQQQPIQQIQPYNTSFQQPQQQPIAAIPNQPIFIMAPPNPYTTAVAPMPMQIQMPYAMPYMMPYNPYMQQPFFFSQQPQPHQMGQQLVPAPQQPQILPPYQPNQQQQQVQPQPPSTPKQSTKPTRDKSFYKALTVVAPLAQPKERQLNSSLLIKDKSNLNNNDRRQEDATALKPVQQQQAKQQKSSRLSTYYKPPSPLVLEPTILYRYQKPITIDELKHPNEKYKDLIYRPRLIRIEDYSIEDLIPALRRENILPPLSRISNQSRTKNTNNKANNVDSSSSSASNVTKRPVLVEELKMPWDRVIIKFMLFSIFFYLNCYSNREKIDKSYLVKLYFTHLKIFGPKP